MKTKNYISLIISAILFYSLTGCYTQVATSEPYATTSVYTQSEDSYDYYSEEGELLDTADYAETDPDGDESLIIVNKFYDYPSYDYYPYLTIVIGFSWYWGWAGYTYYPYWSYYPYNTGYWGYGWCYPSPYYCYYPSYYYYDSYYCNPYYGNGGYYSYYGSYPRDQYVTRVRNNSGGRNYPGVGRNPRVAQTDGSINRVRDDLNFGRDLTVERTKVGSRDLETRNSAGEINRQVVGLNDLDRINNSKRKDISSNEITRTTDIRKDKQQLGLDREVTTKKSLGIDKRNDVSVKNTKTNNLGRNSSQINKKNSVGSETKNVYNRNNTKKQNEVRTNNSNTRQPNVKNNPKSYQTPKRDSNTRTNTPPKQNTNKPRTYSPPKSNNNPPRSYSPPRTNNSPRSNTPPSRNSGSGSSGNRKR